MSVILAIDPGSERSAWIVLNTESLGIRGFAKVENDELRRSLHHGPSPDIDTVVIEWMKPRGMPTSAQEFETLYWIGRFTEAAESGGTPVDRSVARDDVKYHLCGRRSKVTDTNVRAALIDRFGGIGGKAAAIGTKAQPGPLHGISKDVWSALAIAVCYADQEAGDG